MECNSGLFSIFFIKFPLLHKMSLD
uniref:Uncharacterized protein n=1 Tax=Rhizophora mucronata TaxID=61149 RepID=A0A2P2QTB6_RHIMU